MFQAIYLKITGWNILRAAACATMHEIVRAKAQTAVLRVLAAVRTVSAACREALQGLPAVIVAFNYPFPHALGLRHVA